MTTKARQKPCEQCGELIIEQRRWSEAQWTVRRFCTNRACWFVPSDNAYRINGDIAYIDVSTTRYPGKEAVIDAADLQQVIDGRGKWYARFANGTTFYATREVRDADGRTRAEQMHRIIFGLGGGHAIVPDHEDHNGLNNRRSNLRLTDHGKNRANGGPCRKGKFKGVHRRVSPSSTVRYRAIVKANGEVFRSPDYMTPDEAALAYDQAALAVWGEFAYLNFPRNP